MASPLWHALFCLVSIGKKSLFRVVTDWVNTPTLMTVCGVFLLFRYAGGTTGVGSPICSVHLEIESLLVALPNDQSCNTQMPLMLDSLISAVTGRIVEHQTSAH